MTGINYSASGVAVGQHDMVGTDYYQWDPRDPGTIRSIPGNTGLLSVGTGHALENHPVVQGVPDSGNIKGYRASISPPITCEEKTVNHTGRQSYVPGGKAKRIVAYDGKSSCQDYLVQFDLVAEMNDWNGVTRTMELATSLSGVARSVLSDIDVNDRRNYDKLVAALLTRFKPENQSEVYRAQLKGRLRKRSEPLTELAQDVRKLAHKAYPTVPVSARDELAADAFIDALNDVEMEWFIRQGKSQSPDGVLRLALEYEAFQTGRQRRMGAKSVVRAHGETLSEAQGPVSAYDEVIGRIAHLVSNPPAKAVSARTPKACFGCGVVGHFKSDCPKRNDAKSWPNVGNCNHCGIRGHLEADCSKRGQPKVDAPSTQSPHQGRDLAETSGPISASNSNQSPPPPHCSFDSLYVIARLGDADLSCLLDTCATSSILHPNRYHALPEESRPRLEGEAGSLEVADGSFVASHGSTVFTLEVGGQRLILLNVLRPLFCALTLG